MVQEHYRCTLIIQLHVRFTNVQIQTLISLVQFASDLHNLLLHASWARNQLNHEMAIDVFIRYPGDLSQISGTCLIKGRRSK